MDTVVNGPSLTLIVQASCRPCTPLHRLPRQAQRLDGLLLARPAVAYAVLWDNVWITFPKHGHHYIHARLLVQLCTALFVCCGVTFNLEADQQ